MDECSGLDSEYGVLERVGSETLNINEGGLEKTMSSEEIKDMFLIAPEINLDKNLKSHKTISSTIRYDGHEEEQISLLGRFGKNGPLAFYRGGSSVITFCVRKDIHYLDIVER